MVITLKTMLYNFYKKIKKNMENKMTFDEGTNEITRSFIKMLNMAEEMFGKYENKYNFVGIEFRNTVPCIWFYPNDKVSIVLSTNSLVDFPNNPQLYFQLAHEACHLINLTKKENTLVLNEGISTYFSRIYQEIIYPDSTYAIEAIKNSIYYYAYLLVDKMLSYDREIIKKIRKICPDISKITKDGMKRMEKNLNDEEIEELTKIFSYQ